MREVIEPPVVSVVCPVCGSTNVTFTDGGLECLECGVIAVEDDRAIWESE